MKLFLAVLFALSVSVIANAQNISATLKGYFSTSKKDALYSSIYFDGEGHVLINDNYAGEYFQKEDCVYVFPDKSVFDLFFSIEMTLSIRFEQVIATGMIKLNLPSAEPIVNPLSIQFP